MDEVKILGFIKINSERRWIAKCLRETSKLCRRILVIDPRYHHHTAEICKQFNTARYCVYGGENDKEPEHWMAEEKADWFLFLNGDEVLEEGGAETLREGLSKLDPRDPVYSFFYLRVLFFGMTRNTTG
ncbi:hypothetical protein JOC37_000664 [Desulfohalotomaculum tongense]|uniref:hypothetical protein n=1 Tax=Desulforadius tongensis TaxID=1216062 RepID=UPI0019577CCF|nr:hypothetical protein [Desulforadius tongensis]MBM7854291.1 hypothetical protein [Desulforadius tongensis]